MGGDLPPLLLHLLLHLLLLLPLAAQPRSVGVVSSQSLPGWLLLPRTRSSLAWLRHSEPGNFWAVMSLDTDEEKSGGVKYVETVTQTLATPLSVLHKTWFSQQERLPTFSNINNGHQAAPIYYREVSKTPQWRPSGQQVTTIKPRLSYHVPVKHKRPSLFLLIFKIIPRNLYFWFKNRINNLW